MKAAKSHKKTAIKADFVLEILQVSDIPNMSNTIHQTEKMLILLKNVLRAILKSRFLRNISIPSET